MLHMVAVTYESAGEILKVDLLKKATAHYFEVALFVRLREVVLRNFLLFR